MFLTKRSNLLASADREPLRVLFLLSSLSDGEGALLVRELLARLERDKFSPEVACLRSLGDVGKEIAGKVPVAFDFVRHDYDIRVLSRLTNHLSKRKIDAIVTVGTGSTMFWGRLAASCARTPVVLSSLHLASCPEGVGRLNRVLTSITDGFIAGMDTHGRFLSEQEWVPAAKVHIIRHGVDSAYLRRDLAAGSSIRDRFQIPIDAPVCGTVATPQSADNRDTFLKGTSLIRSRFPDAHFFVIGDGTERQRIQELARSGGLSDSVHFLDARDDLVSVLSALNVLAVTSRMEETLTPMLQALSCEVPVVGPRMGSIPPFLIDGETGYAVTPNDAEDLAEKVSQVLSEPDAADRMGKNGRHIIESDWQVTATVDGYQSLITQIYDSKAETPINTPSVVPPADAAETVELADFSTA